MGVIMAHSIKAQNALNISAVKHVWHDTRLFASRFAVSVVMWVPKKIADYRRVNLAVSDLKSMEEKIYRYKLHWGFSSNTPLTSETPDIHSVDGGSVNEDYLSIDDLDEVVRGLIFKIDNYSFYEKFFSFDSRDLEEKVAECNRELALIIDVVENADREL